MSLPVRGLVPVHIGQPEPGSGDERIRSARYERPLRVPGELSWQRHGLEPRWFGMETSDCAVALEPGFFHSYGADERDRFLAGARQRNEVALVVAVIGDAGDDSPRSPLSSFDSSVHLSKTFTSVNGRSLPAGSRPEIAPDLGAADRDLALRLLNRPADAPWWTLHLTGAHLARGDGSGEVHHEAEGELHPILVDALGAPVVAAWTPPAGDQRWYVVPDSTDWDTILDWLTHRALPEYAPGALRRARSPHFTDPDLQTADELSARRSLDDLAAQYAEDKLRLEQQLQEAEGHAEPIRYGLLYGTGAELVDAVAAVLTAAGLDVVNLDEELDATKSADLLVSAGGSSRLVEVKAASGAAPEHLVVHLQRHLDTWPQLRPNQPITEGVLIVNQQHKLHPLERTAQVYSRPEFVDALPFTVLSTVELFGWWRAADWAAIRTAVLDTNSERPTEVADLSQAATDRPSPRRRAKRWWQGDKRRR